MIELDQSPTDPAFVQDPYPFYDRARAAGDLFLWRDYGLICTTTYAATAAILKDRRFGREIPGGFPSTAATAPFYDVEAHSMLELDPPRHTRLRGLVLRAFTSRRIAAMGPEIEALAHDLIDRFPAAGPFDLLDAFARPLPVIVICRLLGVPEARADDLLAWSNAMVAMYQARRTAEIEAAAVTATLAFRAFIEGHIEAKRSQPADDLLSHLIAAEQAGETLSSDELVTTCILLLNAGHEATVHTLGNGLATQLPLGRSAADEAEVEEILRFDPPLHLFTRYAREEVEVFGHRFAPGDTVGCLLGAANRDPAAYPQPDRFDPCRTGPVNLAFGGGIHFCVGAPLARLELRLALAALHARCPGLTLAAPPRYSDVYHFHGLEELTVGR